MNKKICKIIIAVIIILAFIVGIMYFIDSDKMKKGEPVVFSTWGTKYAPIVNEIENQDTNEIVDTANKQNDFSLVFYQKTAIKPKQIEKIISKGEIEEIDYNVYSFEGNVAINLNSDNAELTENSISLRDALLQDKITMEEIIEKANKDFPNVISYDDGGSKEYHYPTYTIIKLNKLMGNKDVYIGNKDMTIHDLNI